MISKIVIRPLTGFEVADNLLRCARMGVVEGVILLPTEAIGERQFVMTLVIDSRLLHSMERMPPFRTGVATRVLRACFSDLAAMEETKDIVVYVGWWKCCTILT